MSQQHPLNADSPDFSEQDIADYLTKHPDFFERHGSVLLNLRLPHATSGATISLVERQIAMLRQKNDQLHRNLRELVSVAKHNDAIVTKIQSLATRFLTTRATSARIEQLETALREDFAAQRAALVLFESGAALQRHADGFLVTASPEDASLKPFNVFLKSGKTRCGLLRDRQKEFLFGAEEALGSAAMVPIGPAAKHGFLVIGNRSKDYFNPGERTDFLDRLGELIAAAICAETSQGD